MENISSILSAQNFSMPAGYVTDGEAEILVSVGDKITDKGELDNLILMDLGIDGMDPIRLSDVATVSYSNMAEDTYAKINGENGVILNFTKQSSYATAVVSDNVADKFKELEEEYDELEFTVLSDQGEYIHIVINSVLQNLLNLKYAHYTCCSLQPHPFFVPTELFYISIRQNNHMSKT